MVSDADDGEVEAGRSNSFPTEPASPDRSRAVERTRAVVLMVLGCLGVLLVGYVAWLVPRRHFSYSRLWNGWMPDGFELIVSGLCIARGLVRQSGRAVALALGFGLLSWSLGDSPWTVQSVIGTSSATKLLGALFYVGFYPLAYVAIVAFMRRRLRAISAPSLLDGAVAALGAATVCAAFAFQGSEYAVTNDTLTKATNQLDLRSGKIAAVEALVRWQHPRLGIIAPAKFLPLAEQAELMPALTALLLDNALAQGSKWAEARPTLTVSVNISATNLLDHDFTDLVRNLLSRHRFPPSRLALEITETSVIENFEQAKLVIEELASIGVVVSVDDYGAGFTAISYLSSLAVRELKLDMRLITGLASASRERDRELVRSTIELGHALGLRVVAEGIEDEATLDLLRQLKCDFAQGYFISRPVPADEVLFGVDVQEPAPSLLPAQTAVASTN